MIRSQWSKISEWPQRLDHKIENLNPDLARNVLSYASQMVQPQLLASQFLLEEWGDTRVGVTISSRLRGLAGVLAAAELCHTTIAAINRVPPAVAQKGRAVRLSGKAHAKATRYRNVKIKVLSPIFSLQNK